MSASLDALSPDELRLYGLIDLLHGACLRAKHRLTEARDPAVLRTQLDNIAWCAEKIAAFAPCPDCALGACTSDHGVSA